MSITIDLPPDLEAKLHEVAAELGQDAVAFATAAVIDTVRESMKELDAPTGNGRVSDTDSRLTWKEFATAMDRLAEENAELPLLTPEATKRAALYEDHD